MMTKIITMVGQSPRLSDDDYGRDDDGDYDDDDVNDNDNDHDDDDDDGNTNDNNDDDNDDNNDDYNDRSGARRREQNGSHRLASLGLEARARRLLSL